MTESFSSRYLSGNCGYTVLPVFSFCKALARALRAASQTLANLASRLSAFEARTERTASKGNSVSPQVEFYAEAGAAEGALFADGNLVGYLPVSRL